MQYEIRPVFCWPKREMETSHWRWGIQHKFMNLVELKQALETKCESWNKPWRPNVREGRGISGRQKRAKAKQGMSMQAEGSGQHCEAGEPTRSDHSLDRCLASSYAAHSSQMLQKPLLYCNHNTSIGQVIVLNWKKRNHKRDIELAKVRQWPKDGLRTFQVSLRSSDTDDPSSGLGTILQNGSQPHSVGQRTGQSKKQSPTHVL